MGPARKLLWSAVLGTLVLGAVEGALRLSFGPPRPWVLDNRMIRDQLSKVPELYLTLEQTAAVYREDPDCIWSLRPNVHVRARMPVHPSLAFTILTDEQGLRLPTGSRRTGRPVVLALGDSKTFGWGVEGDEAYPAVLERLLGELGVEAEVVNGAIPGGDIVQGRALLEARLLDLAPAAIVCWFTGDNAGEVPEPDRVLIERLSSPPYRLLFLVSRSSWLASWMRARFVETGGVWRRMERLPPAERFTEEEFAGEVATLEAIAAARGVSLLFLDKPILDGSEGSEDGRRWNEVLRAQAGRLGSTLVRLDDAFEAAGRDGEAQAAVRARYAGALAALEEKVWKGSPKGRLFADPDAHPNAVGHRVVAEAVRDALVRAGWGGPGAGAGPITR